MARLYTGNLNRLPDKRSKRDYKWVALSNTTLGVLLATIDASIVLIAMPAIFRASISIHSSPVTASTCSG